MNAVQGGPEDAIGLDGRWGSEAHTSWGDGMDAPETINGKDERAPVEGALESDIPTQSLGKKCCPGHLHMAFLAE